MSQPVDPSVSRLRSCFFCLAGCLALALALPVRAEEPFDYFSNSWGLIGLKDYVDGTRITPSNELLLAEKAEYRLWYGRHTTPFSRKQTKTLLEGWLPVVLLAAEQEKIRYELKLWSTPLPTVKDWQAAFQWPTEGENYLNWIWVTARNVGEERAEARFRGQRTGPASEQVSAFSWSLEPGQSAQAVLRVPFATTDPKAFADADPQLWLDRTIDFWQKCLAQGTRFEIPDRRANHALLASHVYQFINNDHGVVKGGEGFYDQFYIRDGAYEVQQFEEAGFLDAARKAMEAYVAAQRPDGRFETQKGQFDANGQAVWALWQFYQITGDRQWLERVYPAMVRAVEWTMKARREAPVDSPFAGVLPNALADGEYLWNGKYHIVGYDFWNLRGLLCTTDAARVLGKAADVQRFESETAEYRAALDAVWRRTGLPHFPPSWEKAGTHWGNTETLWPTPLFKIEDPRVAALITEVRERFGGGFHEGTIRWCPGTVRSAIHPYMSSYTTMASLARGEHEAVVKDFYWYLLHSTAAHAFPEGIYYRRRFAWSDTIPHATGASNYAFLLRHMLVHEAGSELHLLPAVPDWWLGSGQEIHIQRAPTHFGPLSLHVVGTTEGVQVKLQIPTRRRPQRIVLHLPKSRSLVAELKGVEVAVRTNQKARWDLPAMIALYQAIKPEQVAGLLSLPLDEPPAPDSCQFLDLTPLANTDPFTAPFGVANPGRFLFTGLQVGKQTVGGVPFAIIDPTKNDGRGLVVLQGGPEKLAANGYPHEVAIPAGRQGKRIFVLGNVVGWSSRDTGVGSPAAVAEYVVCYADGKQQKIPLILGQTADDWAGRPVADQVQVVASGEPWHLSLLAAPLRSVPVEKVVFRDLGTVSAPLLVAITIEK